MPGWDTMGRWLMVAGAVLLALGGLVSLLGKLGLGRLPGDIVWRKGPVTVFFPLATSLLLSLLLTIIVNLFLRR